MIKLLRTILFSFLIILALGYLTSLLYYSAGQIEKRTSRALQRYISSSPVIVGARQSWMEPLTIERIEIPAAPVIDQRDILLLYDLEVENSGDPGSPVGRPGSPGRGLLIRSRRGGLFLDRELVPGPGSVASVPTWNYQGLLGRGITVWEAAREFIRAGHEVAIKEIQVELQEIRKREEKATWAAGIGDLSIRVASGEILDVRGDFQASPYWSEGQFQIVFRPDFREREPALELRGSLDNVKGLDEWFSLLIPEHRHLAAVLKPSGPITFHLGHLRYFPSRNRDVEKLDYLASFRHYDSTFRLLPWDLEITHIHGTVTLDTAGFTFGPGKEDGSRLSGEIWGTEVHLQGKIQTDGGEFAIQIPETDLRGTAVSAQPGRLARIWKWLRPSGSLNGQLTSSYRANVTSRWGLALEFQNLAFVDLPVLGPSSGKLSLKEERGRRTGLLSITSGHIEPLGEVQGKIPLEWSGQGVSFRPAGLLLGEGSISGEVQYQPDRDAVSGSLRFDHSNLNIAEGLLISLRTGGKAEFSTTEEGFCGQGRIDLERITLMMKRIPGGEQCGEDAIEFTDGQLLFSIGPTGVEPMELILRGQRGTLRLWGMMGYRGDLNAVAALAVGEPGRKLGLLGAGASPGEWRRVVGDETILLRLSGSGLQPRIRSVEWSDPMFQRIPDRSDSGGER